MSQSPGGASLPPPDIQARADRKAERLREILTSGIPRVFISRAQWLEARLSGIGGSEAAAVVGASRFKAPFTLWAEKSRLVEPEDLGENEVVEWGNRAEPTVAQKFQEVAECQFFLLEPHEILMVGSEWVPYRFASPDRMILEPTPVITEWAMARAQGEGSSQLAPFNMADLQGPGVLEIKTAFRGREGTWEEEPPLDPMIQLQNNMEITGATWGVFAVLFGGSHFQTFGPFSLDIMFRDWLRKHVEAFWGRVEDHNPPEVQAEDERILARLYPDEEPEKVVQIPEAWDLHQRLQAAQREIEGRVSEIKALKNRLRQKIGSAEIGVISPEVSYTLKTTKKGGFYTGPSQFRTLRVQERREG